MSEVPLYRCISRIRKRIPLGPYRSSIFRVLGKSKGGGCFLMGEVPLYIMAETRHDEPDKTRLHFQGGLCGYLGSQGTSGCKVILGKLTRVPHSK